MFTAAGIGTLAIILVVANIFIFILEVLTALAKVVLGFVMSKPHDFKKTYLESRIFYTKIINKIMFALVSPKGLHDYMKKYEMDKKTIFRREVKKAVDDYLNKVNKKEHHL